MENFTPHRIAFVGLVVVWQIIAMIGIWPSNVFPSPYEVFSKTWHTLQWMVALLWSGNEYGD